MSPWEGRPLCTLGLEVVGVTTREERGCKIWVSPVIAVLTGRPIP